MSDLWEERASINFLRRPGQLHPWSLNLETDSRNILRTCKHLASRYSVVLWPYKQPSLDTYEEQHVCLSVSCLWWLNVLSSPPFLTFGQSSSSAARRKGRAASHASAPPLRTPSLERRPCRKTPASASGSNTSFPAAPMAREDGVDGRAAQPFEMGDMGFVGQGVSNVARYRPINALTITGSVRNPRSRSLTQRRNRTCARLSKRFDEASAHVSWLLCCLGPHKVTVVAPLHVISKRKLRAVNHRSTCKYT